MTNPVVASAKVWRSRLVHKREFYFVATMQLGAALSRCTQTRSHYQIHEGFSAGVGAAPFYAMIFRGTECFSITDGPSKHIPLALLAKLSTEIDGGVSKLFCSHSRAALELGTNGQPE